MRLFKTLLTRNSQPNDRHLQAIDITDVEFFTFDVETANEDFGSICQIGVSVVKNGIVHETHAVDINPKCAFSTANINIHGITPERVEKSPVFSEAIRPFEHLFRNTIAISHSNFDTKAISGACARANIDNPVTHWLDSMKVVRNTWPDQFGKRGYGLANLSQHFDIPFNHHDAGEDARVTAEIMLRAFKASGKTPQEWLTFKKPKAYYPNKKVTAEANENGPLFGEVAVFTGELTISRKDAAALAAKAGIIVANGVTKKTTILIVGDQDLTVLAGHEKSSKHRKAEDLIAKGQPIRILGESEFLKLIVNN